jgi:hypothetical protein
MPPAAINHAMIAPNGPVAFPKVRGSEKMPEPTIDPTTIPVSANSDNFCTDLSAKGPPAACPTGTMIKAAIGPESVDYIEGNVPAYWAEVQLRRVSNFKSGLIA